VVWLPPCPFPMLRTFRLCVACRVEYAGPSSPPNFIVCFRFSNANFPDNLFHFNHVRVMWQVISVPAGLISSWSSLGRTPVYTSFFPVDFGSSTATMENFQFPLGRMGCPHSNPTSTLFFLREVVDFDPARMWAFSSVAHWFGCFYTVRDLRFT